jgi:hypothetical protein
MMIPMTMIRMMIPDCRDAAASCCCTTGLFEDSRRRQSRFEAPDHLFSSRPVSKDDSSAFLDFDRIESVNGSKQGSDRYTGCHVIPLAALILTDTS